MRTTCCVWCLGDFVWGVIPASCGCLGCRVFLCCGGCAGRVVTRTVMLHGACSGCVCCGVGMNCNQSCSCFLGCGCLLDWMIERFFVCW